MRRSNTLPHHPAAPPKTSGPSFVARVFGTIMAVMVLCGTNLPASAEKSVPGDAIWAGQPAPIAEQAPVTEQAMSTAPVLRETESADMVLLYKGRRTLYLMRDGEVLRSYSVALGRNPFGHKNQEGDGRTPEGGYLIDWRNPNSDFHLSLHISYPRPQDYRQAREAGVDPGGAIMIHGLPNGRTADEVGHPRFDWTNGCIAVSNEEIEEIWELVEDGTAIFILP